MENLPPDRGRHDLPFSKTGVLAPGRYQVEFDVFPETPQPLTVSRASGNLTFSVSPTTHDFHWINPNSGFFATSTNWNPAGVPGGSDTAIFDLSGTAPITVEAQNEIVARLLNHGMDLELHGSVQVVTAPFPTQFGFVVDQGGQLLLSNGANLNTQDGDVGGPTGSPESTVFVNGATWAIGASRPLDIGNQAPGTVVVNGTNDAFLHADNSILLGLNGGAGTLRVESGGLVLTPFCTIEKGSVRVLGKGPVNDSTLLVDSDLKVGGQKGPGSMSLENGGTVQAQNVVVGDTAGNAGDTITISGVDNGGVPSTLIVNGVAFLSVAGGAGTQVEVKDGGFLRVGPSGFTSIGFKFDVGKVTVHGKAGNRPATWDMLGDVHIGGQIVPSELIVTDGGRVNSSGEIIVGLDANKDLGSVEVSGTDSFLSAATLHVGAQGHGELTIGPRAHVQSVTGIVGQSSPTGPAVGSGSVTIDGRILTPSEWHVTGDCFVGVNEPGLVLLKNANSITSINGIVSIDTSGATLRVDGTLTVGPQGSIKGSGTLVALNRVINRGKIRPGLSPGAIVIQGDYEQTADGVLEMEAAGLNAGQFDVLHVTGKSTLGGTMEVTFLNGYLPKTGDVLPFLQLDGEITGNFSQITFPQLAPGFQVKTEVVNGKYQLTALNDAVRLFVKEMFRGLLAGDPASHHDAGFFTIHTTARAGFSARFVLGGRSFALSGKFDSAGKFSKTIPRQGAAPLTINLELAVIDGARVITGAIVDGDQSIPISADQAKAFNAKTNPAPQAGKYTALLQFDSAASDTPQANGIGVVGISTSGAIRFVGALPDGTRLSQGTVLSKSGEWPLYVLLYKKQGSLFGELQFREKAGSDFEGMLQWSRPPTPNDKIQTAGFFATLLTIGSKYVAPPARPAVLDLPNGATATLSDADLTPALTKSLTFTPPNNFVVLDPGADKLSLSASAPNGLLSGRFIHPKTSSSTTVQGVIFQKQNLGSGFFLRPSVIGSFEMLANP